MALVPCVECGREISTAAEACPGCGHPSTWRAPETVGGAVVAGARSAAKSKVWDRLYTTSMVLAFGWLLLLWFVAAVSAFEGRESREGLAAITAVGVVPVAALWGLRKWFDWLRSR